MGASGLPLAAMLDRIATKWAARRELRDSCPAWLRKLQVYLKDPRLTTQEVWYRYARARRVAAPFFATPNMTTAEAEDFFRSDYIFWRQVIYRRHTTWRRVLWTMEGREGTLVELGCGIAPVSAWIAPRRPSWTYCLEDLDGTAFDYARARLASFQTKRWKEVEPGEVTVLVCLDVLEHLPDPSRYLWDALGALRKGGVIHWNCIWGDAEGTNLATRARRVEARTLIQTVCPTIWNSPDHTVGIKR